MMPPINGNKIKLNRPVPENSHCEHVLKHFCLISHESHPLDSFSLSQYLSDSEFLHSARKYELLEQNNDFVEFSQKLKNWLLIPRRSWL